MDNNDYLYSIGSEMYNILCLYVPILKGRNLQKIGTTSMIESRKFFCQTDSPYPKYYNWYIKIHDLGRFSCKFQAEKTIHNHPYFKKRHFYIQDGGTEFFHFNENESSLKKVCDILLNYNVKFEVFEKDIFTEKPSYISENRKRYDEVECLMPEHEDDEIEKKILRPHQDKSKIIMINNKIGIFVLVTGSGKTIIFLFFLKEQKGINLILVPTKKLVRQTYKVAKELNFGNVIKCYSDDTFDSDKMTENCLIISTYQSSQYLLKYDFNTIIFDECHLTVLSSVCSEDMGLSGFQQMLIHGKADKKFFFTATEKTVSLKNTH